ncbi:hypothetical protein AUC61_12640 [Pseudomonas sp. S25]|uniref:Capsule polysaccharide biosynthesis protein n=1 Tax=Pseudomonas maioricensis TaxID=1766623 RepID=A0ABS9ZIH2_9PSED|nr:hypothetical protein [Pseudomonas sp. S25]MCI8210386.1 hypothetical protein [Pseudomonas sp. S25]
MSLEYCVLTDGSVVQAVDIRAKYALSIFQTDLFYDVCEVLARRHRLEGVDHKVLVNLYALKSSRVKDIAALVYYVSEHLYDVAEVHGRDDSIFVLRALVGTDALSIHSVGDAPGSHVERSARLSIAMKIIFHRVFRLIPSRVRTSDTVVRGWVDVTEAMYPEEVFESTLMLYPFPYGVARQFRFFRSMRRRGAKVKFVGLPYPFISLARLLLGGNKLDAHIVRLETLAYQRYARELIAMGVREVRTSDEFEVGAVAMYERLMDGGVEVVNTAHGVGLYSPYVAYSEFKGVNIAQSNFYRQRCPRMNPGLRRSKNSTLPLASADAARNLPPAIVLLDQNFMVFNCVAEAEALAETQRLLEAFCTSAKLPLFIKIHPNSAPTEQSDHVRQVRDWADLAGYRPVFVTINSTAFYDVQGYGPILVCDEPSFLPVIYFGEDLLVYRFDTLATMLENLISENAWWSAASRHMPIAGD